MFFRGGLVGQHRPTTLRWVRSKYSMHGQKERNLANQITMFRRPDAMGVRRFAARAVDAHATTWLLCVETSYRTTLHYDGDIIAMLTSEEGAEILGRHDGPFERAEGLLARIIEPLGEPLDVHVRLTLETQLGRWLANHH